MGARSSKGSITKKESSRANVQQHEFKNPNPSRTNTPEEKQTKAPVSCPITTASGNGGSDDVFYDGIPRLSQKSRSMSFRVSARKAGSFGIEKAVDVLDTLGSSMANLNSSSGFLTGPTTKGNQLSILSFEVANTIVKGSRLMQSVSKRSVKLFKEAVFVSEGVQNLVSRDVDVLLRTVATDKREELMIFVGEVVRFGNQCKDPQWHNLDLYFEKQSRGLTRPKQLKEDPGSVMLQLMTLVQHTAELYQKLSVLDKLEQDHKEKHQQGANSISIPKGYELASLRQELKSQTKQVKLLKKKSLWSRSMEEVMEKLVDTVIYLTREIQNAFEPAYDNVASNEVPSVENKLGPAGLALHYANIVLQIDSIVARSSSMTYTARSTLYQSLTPNILSSLRAKLVSFPVEKQLSIGDIKAEMEKTLCWLSPVAISTAKAHHGFGWVGEWADTGWDANRKPSGVNDIQRIETFHHADKETTEAHIVELLLWLNHLMAQTKATEVQSNTKSNHEPPQEASSTSVPSIEHNDESIEGLVV